MILRGHDLRGWITPPRSSYRREPAEGHRCGRCAEPRSTRLGRGDHVLACLRREQRPTFAQQWWIILKRPSDGAFRDAKHMADASETALELWIDRVMHTTWEHVLTY